MTSNQINYSRFAEDQRHNLISESQGYAAIKQRDQEIAIARRNSEIAAQNAASNAANAQANLLNAATNQARVGYDYQLGQQQLAEQNRHNMAMEANERNRTGISGAGLVTGLLGSAISAGLLI
jgi:hypothetical protein